MSVSIVLLVIAKIKECRYAHARKLDIASSTSISPQSQPYHCVVRYNEWYLLSHAQRRSSICTTSKLSRRVRREESYRITQRLSLEPGSCLIYKQRIWLGTLFMNIRTGEIQITFTNVLIRILYSQYRSGHLVFKRAFAQSNVDVVWNMIIDCRDL